MRIAGTEPSLVILGKQSSLKSLKRRPKSV